MLKETLVLAAIQSGVLFLALWGIFQLVPSFPANAKAWLWRLAFLKPLLSLLPFAVVTLPILPAKQPVQVVGTDYGYAIEPIPVTSASITPPAPEALQIDPLLVAWCIGVIGVAGHALWGMRRALRIARSAQEVSDPELQAWFDVLLDRAGIHRRPALLSSKAISGAMLVGGRQYAVVLPAQAEHEDVRLMMAHEVAHIKRQDLLWFGLASTVQSLFFFNPMVWVAARCSRLDHESATDRDASHLAGVPIQKYAAMLLRATTVARPSLAPGVLPVAESYRTIHRRLEAMKHFNSTPTFWRRTAIAVLAMLTLGMLPAYNIVAAAWPVEGTEQTAPPDISVDAYALNPVATSRQEGKAQREEAARRLKRLRIQKELARLKAKEANLRKMQAELERKSKLTGKPSVALKQVKGQVLEVQQATASTKALIVKPVTVIATKEGKGNSVQRKPATAFVAKEVKLVDGTKILVAPTTDIKVVPVVLGKDGKPTSTFVPQKSTGHTIFQWSPTEKKYIAKPPQTSAPITTHVVEAGKVQWRVQDTSKESRVWRTWAVEGTPKQGSTQYMITGKNVTITMKDGVYFISGDGPISIRAVEGVSGPAKIVEPAKGGSATTDSNLAIPTKSIQGVANPTVGSRSVTTIATETKATLRAHPQTTVTYKPTRLSPGTAIITGDTIRYVAPRSKANTQIATVREVQAPRNIVRTRVGLKPAKVIAKPAKKEEKKVPPTIDPVIFPPN